MRQNTIVGIDYSLTSPCVCINDGKNIMFYYLTKKKKHLGKIADNIIGEEHLEYNTPIERFSNISNWAINKFNILGHNLKVFIEGYSYGSKGQALFQIAENCGILKYKLQERNIPYLIRGRPVRSRTPELDRLPNPQFSLACRSQRNA